jgi:hypothetical protein
MRRMPCLALLLGALSCGGCFSARPVDFAAGSTGEPQALGAFTVASERLGHPTIAPTTCTAGDRQFFLGADFEDEKNGMIVRLVVDPLEGPAVRVFAAATPFGEAVVFRRSECRVFHFSLDTTGWRIDHIQDYRLSLELDCANKAGDSLVGKASATHCH